MSVQATVVGLSEGPTLQPDAGARARRWAFPRSARLTIGLVIVGFFVLMAVVGPYLVGNPLTFHTAMLHAPTTRFLLGTTQLGQDVFLQREKPAIDNGPKGAGLDRRSGEALHQAAVHGLQTMQRGFGLADLDFRCRKAEVLRPFLNPARKEGLSATVLAANGFEFSAAGAYGFKFVGDRAFEVAQAHGKRFEATPWHGTSSKSVDNIGAALWADGSHRLNWRSRSGRSRTTMSAASSIVRMP